MTLTEEQMDSENAYTYSGSLEILKRREVSKVKGIKYGKYQGKMKFPQRWRGEGVETKKNT